MGFRSNLKNHIVIVLMVIGSLIVFAQIGLLVQNGLRAYVGGEGLYSKGQKEATYQLIQYLHSGDERRYEAFRENLAIPLGDRRARLELESPDSRREEIREGFLQGGNHPDDFSAMFALFRLFRNVPYVEQAIEQWRIADGLIVDLDALGTEIHSGMRAGDLSDGEVEIYLARLDALQRELNTAVTGFSYLMSSAARWTTGALLALMAALSVVGGIVCIFVLRANAAVVRNLERSEGRFRRLTENARDVIYRMALPSGRYEYVSPACGTMFGYPPEDFMEDPTLITRVIHPDWRDYFRTQWTRLLQGDMPPFYEYQILHPSGETRWVNQRNVLIRDAAGRPAAIEGIVTDITKFKQLEDERERMDLELRQAHKMEAIGTLAGGIAHDFNNILFSILGHAELASMDVEEDGEVAASLREIRTASLRARDLVKSILTFSRAEVQQQEPVDLAEVIREAEALLRGSLPADIRIVTEIESGCGPVLAEPSQIHQVIMNLCTNASQAMEDTGGTLSIGLSTPPQAGGGPGCVELTVRDTGTGIPQDILTRVFDPYFTTKPAGKGTGFGLAVVHGIVTGAGGSIDVDTAPGQGTAMKITLPVTDGTAPQAAVPETIRLEGDARILYVDDEPAILSFVGKLLARRGYHVTAVSTGREALDLLRQDPAAFDLLITDQMMPEMKGTQLAESAAGIRPDLPIVICTGFCEDLEALAGRHAVVTKPIDRDGLLAAIREALEIRCSPLPVG